MGVIVASVPHHLNANIRLFLHMWVIRPCLLFSSATTTASEEVWNIAHSSQRSIVEGPDEAADDVNKGSC